jgi:protein arginine kinase
MKLENLTNTVGEWLRGTGPESDIVMSSRVRLARNVAQFPFVSRATEQDRADIEKFLRERIAKSPAGAALEYIDVGGLEEVDRQFLVERQLISRELAEAQGARAVAIDGREQVSLMTSRPSGSRSAPSTTPSARWCPTPTIPAGATSRPAPRTWAPASG